VPGEGNFDEGIAVFLRSIWPSKPDAIDAHSILRQLYWRKNDIQAYLESTINSANCDVKAQDAEVALQDYQEYSKRWRESHAAATWLELWP